jgi:hypothetical protein
MALRLDRLARAHRFRPADKTFPCVTRVGGPRSSLVRDPLAEGKARHSAISALSSHSAGGYYTYLQSACAGVLGSNNGSPRPPILESQNTPGKYIFCGVDVLLRVFVPHTIQS